MLLKKITDPFISSLTKIYKQIIETESFPSFLKLSKICPIYKTSNKIDPSNYRLIAVFPMFSKILGLILNNNLIAINQFGFLPDHSTARLSLRISLCKRDYSKAFDCPLDQQICFTLYDEHTTNQRHRSYKIINVRIHNSWSSPRVNS